MLNTYDMEKYQILMALYAGSKPQGMKFLHYTPGDLDEDLAKELADKHDYYDYLKGRVMKISLSKLDPALYDRDNGNGAAQRALDDFYTRPKKKHG